MAQLLLEVLSCLSMQKRLEEAVISGSASSLIAELKPLVTGASEADARAAVDSVIRDAIVRLLESDADARRFEALLSISIEAGKNGVSTASLPISLLSDVFDVKTLEDCEKLFCLVECRVDVWKSEPFFRTIKNQLLRTCNDLLRRLSRSQNTVFCGRILVFLARFFPLFERSGLNLIGEFNKDNVTAISADGGEEQSAAPVPNDAGQTPGDLEEGEEATTTAEAVPAIDHHSLHRKFWQLQDFFRQPQLCYQQAEWRRFQSFTSDVLSAFTANKLDAGSSSNSEGIIKSPDNIYFAKYLTNQKLLELQLSDSSFRRYILIQFLITFQYLTLNVRFKSESQVLADGQKDFVRDAEKQVMDLISQTPPNGAEMAKVIGQILRREEYWNEWKNEGCGEVKPDDLPKPRILVKEQTRGAGDEILSAERHGKHSLGNRELSRLWNLCPDNWEACRSKKRVFTPTVEEYFEEIANANRDKRLRTISGDPNFTWRGLRLLSQKSSHFFAPSTQLVRPVYAYMDSVVDSLSLVLATDSNRPNEAMDDAEDISDEEFLKLPDDGGRESNATSPARDGATNGTVALLSKELIVQIAPKVASYWKKLAREFTFTDDEVEYWESETPDDPALATERSCTGAAVHTDTRLYDQIVANFPYGWSSFQMTRRSAACRTFSPNSKSMCRYRCAEANCRRIVPSCNGSESLKCLTLVKEIGDQKRGFLFVSRREVAGRASGSGFNVSQIALPKVYRGCKGVVQSFYRYKSKTCL